MQDSQQYQDEATQLKSAIKFKQENQRVKIRKEKVNKILQNTRLKFANQDEPEFVNEYQNSNIISLENNEAIVAQQLKQLTISYNLKDFGACLKIVSFFSRYSIFNSDSDIMEASLKVLNQTEFGIYLIEFIDQYYFKNHYDLFEISLRILQNIPFGCDDAQIKKLVEHRLIERLLQIISNLQKDDVVNYVIQYIFSCNYKALFSLANFCGINQTIVFSNLIELSAVSTIVVLNQYDCFKKNLLFLYENIFGSMQADIKDFNEDDQGCMQNLIFYLINCLNNGWETGNEEEIEKALWSLSGLSRMQALVHFDNNSEYPLLLNILDKMPKERIIIPIIQIVNYLSYNSDKNIEQFLDFDYLEYLKKYSDHTNQKIRLHTVYSFANMAACESESTKKRLIDINLVTKLIVMMQKDTPKIQKLSAHYFMNLIQDSGENFVCRQIQEFHFMKIAKQIFEQINDSEVIQNLLKTFEYILGNIQSEQILDIVIREMESLKIDECIDGLTLSNFEFIKEKATSVYEMYNQIKQNFDIE